MYLRLYGSELLCDFKISCGGEQLPVHSVVLYSQSLYFRRLFMRVSERARATKPTIDRESHH